MNLENYIRLLLKHKNKVIGLWLVMLLCAATILLARLITTDTLVDNSVGVWFDTADPEIKTYEDYNTTFGKKEWTVLLLKTKSIYDLKFLRQLDLITNKLSKIKHVVKVTSITNVRDNWINEEGELDYRKLFSIDESELAADEYIARYKQQLAENPIFDKNLINTNNDQYTVVLVQNRNYIYDPSPYRTEIVNAVGSIVSEYDTIVDWGLAGTTVVNAELNKAAQKDVIIFYVLVSIFLALICWRIFRSVKDLCVVLSVVLTSIVSSMALLAILEIPYNMATVMLPPILIALSVVGVLHIITDFHHLHQDHDAENALLNTMSNLWVPAMWAMVTTIAGLCSFGFSNVFPIFQLGMLGAFGMLMAWLANMIIVPILVFKFWSRQKKSLINTESFSIENNGTGILRRPWILGILMMVIIGALAGLKNAEVDTDYSKFFSESTRITRSYDLLHEAGFGQNPIILQIKHPEGREFIEQEYFQQTLAFEQELKTLPQVIKVLSISDLIREIDKAYNGPDTEDRFANYTQAQQAQLLLLGELSGNDDINDLALESRNEHQLVVLTPYLSSKQMRSLKNQVDLLKNKTISQQVEIVFTGTTVLWANMDTQISRTQIYSLLFIGLFLLICLPFVFQSVWMGLLGVLINFLPLAATLGLMSWFDIKINMATVILGAISIGVVVDDTIHMFYRIQQQRRQGNNMQQAVAHSMRSVGTSIYRTTVILIVAFTCMATSDFLPTAHFGIFVSVSVLIALFLDLIIAPALLVYFSNKSKVHNGFLESRT